MDKYYLAVDIGASSGRHMLASMKDGKMQLEEVYRFPNGMTEKNGTLCWDVERKNAARQANFQLFLRSSGFGLWNLPCSRKVAGM